MNLSLRQFVLISSLLLPLNLTISKTSENIFRIKDNEPPKIAAHRAGAGLAPEETLKAFEVITEQNYNVSLIEVDIHKTKDNQLILLHDDTLDRTSNAAEHFQRSSIAVENINYADLQYLNMGENFINQDGDYPYRGLRDKDIPDNLKVLKLDNALDFIEHHKNDYLLSIEIKNSNLMAFQSADILHKMLTEKNLLDSTVVSSFSQLVLLYLDIKYPNIIRSAGPLEIFAFYLASQLNLPSSPNDFKYQVLQLPYYPIPILGFFGIGSKAFNDYAHKNNIATQYWTVNDIEQMKYLKENGADMIITDYPNLAQQALYTRQYSLEQAILASMLTAPIYYISLGSNQLILNQQLANNISNRLIPYLQTDAPIKNQLNVFIDYNTSNVQKATSNSNTLSAMQKNSFQYLNLGTIYHMTDNNIIGIMLSINKGDKGIYQNYQYKQLASNLSLFGLYHFTNNTWVASSITIGKNKLSNINRNLELLATPISKNNTTASHNLMLNLSLGHNFELNNNLILTPSISYTLNKIKIKAYRENPLNQLENMALQFKTNNINANIIKTGITLSSKNQSVNFHGQFNYNYLLSNNKSTVHYKTTQMPNYVTKQEEFTNKHWFEFIVGTNIKLNKNASVYGDIVMTKASAQKIQPSFTTGFKWRLN